MNITTIREALVWASSFLAEAGSRDPRFEAELIIRHILDMDRTSFLISLPEPITNDKVQELVALCQRRAQHEPIQYMVGKQEFYGREFMVAPGVLIPRPETEILIEEVLKCAEQIWSADDRLEVVDIGTGSGAISLTIACECPQWKVTTVDLSTDAISIAKQNAHGLGVTDRVSFLHGDLTKPLLAANQRVDILISNPPYIPSADVDVLDLEVREHEPRLALDGGEDGLDCYRSICRDLPLILKSVNLVGFEVGIHQAQDVEKLLLASGVIQETRIIPDLAGIERVVLGWSK